jgi:hypothetical protein
MIFGWAGVDCSLGAPGMTRPMLDVEHFERDLTCQEFKARFESSSEIREFKRDSRVQGEIREFKREM